MNATNFTYVQNSTKTYHEAIEVFQGEYIICAPVRMIELQTKGNANYVVLILEMTHNL